MTSKRIFGYADPWSLKAGEPVSFMMSGEGVDRARLQIVRLLHGDENPEGPGFLEEAVATSIAEETVLFRQFTQIGSYAIVDDPGQHLTPVGDFTLYAFFCPTKPGTARQAILSKWDVETGNGYGLGIDPSGHLEFWMGDGRQIDQLRAEVPLQKKVWYLAIASYEAVTRTATIHQIGLLNRYNSIVGPVVPTDYNSSVREVLRVRGMSPGAHVPFLWAGASEENDRRGRFVGMLYNGKIDRAGLTAGLLGADAIAELARSGAMPRSSSVIAHWDTTVGYTDDGIGDTIHDIGDHALHAQGFNRPVRGMTGWNWLGRDDSFRINPSQYGGIAFHDDALTDCRWSVSTTLATTHDMKSGVYALKATAGDIEEYIPFFIRAARPRAKLAVLMSTFTYLAYANEHLAYDAFIAQAIIAHTPILTESDIEFVKLDEFGLSTYDHHSDGAGVCYSSWRRPILNIKPKHRMSSVGIPWGLPADLSLLWWLEHAGFDYEIITDHDLHAEGVDALSPYLTVINCTHPEYYSERMLDATEDYLCKGGRLIYPGGNGYYWVSGLREDEPYCMEVRKLDAGSRAWQADPGESYLASTGERSGLWRSRGRAPQKIVGVGFTSEGMDESKPFERMPDSFHRRASWIFEGIGDEELIGDFGLGMGGAAGIEIDRYDLALGTPPHTLLLASSHGHSDNYPLVSEEVTYAFPGRGGTQDPQVRADITFFTTLNHGACLSIGSIAWSQSLPCKKGENNVGRVMRNVLNAFLCHGALPGTTFSGDEKLWR